MIMVEPREHGFDKRGGMPLSLVFRIDGENAEKAVWTWHSLTS